MTFSDAPVLRTDKKLLLRYEGVTVDNLLQFRRLDGFHWAYGVMRGTIDSGETIFLENSITITDLIKQPLDIVHLFGEFEILTNYKTNITSLNTCYYFEYFYFHTMSPKLILNE